MKRFVVVALGFLFVSGMQTSQPPLPPLAIEISVKPSSMDPYMLLERKTPFTYSCEAMMRHPTENRAYGRAMVYVRPGTSETKRVRAEGFDAKFTVGIGRNRDLARAEVEITRNGEFVTRQTSVIRLTAPPPLR